MQLKSFEYLSDVGKKFSPTTVQKTLIQGNPVKSLADLLIVPNEAVYSNFYSEISGL